VFESGVDGVIVALGGKTSDVGDTMLTVGTKNVMSAMKSKGVKRIAVVTSIGAGMCFCVWMNNDYELSPNDAPPWQRI
jgi:hypothetical protein